MSEFLSLDRALIRVSGPGAVSFLDNLLTQDLERLADAGVLYAALLSPQGKVAADMFVWPHADGVVLELDPARAADLMRKLTLYKLRAPVEIEDVSSQQQVLFSLDPFEGARADPRFPDGALGWRALAAPAANAEPGDAAYEARRLALGAPDLDRDAAPEEVFALEALLEELNGVDFQKGCFVGQENVSRMKRRATTRKKFCPIAFDGAPPSPGTAITAGPAEIGSVRTGATGRAMALLRLDRAMEAADAGHALTAEGREVRLDPPEWLLLPQRKHT